MISSTRCGFPSKNNVAAHPRRLCRPRLTLEKAASARCLRTSALRLIPSGSGDCGHLYDDPSECPTLPDIITLPDAGTSLLVGREVDGEGCIALPTVSGVHARVDVSGNGGVTVTDLDSTNGTYVENDTCDANRPTPLQVGKTVTFGDPFLAKFTLVDDSE
ncbi:hypothetical protein PPROV_001040100 [Pycnococcus provasolii]|uniref:FHA domain-containing protein n=1 Tax=Pycnococcus provasolii TaxID=41880 RepID=A0A830HY40_9CHLO|nr:hypothetical protein PPROV_001040100 [Pycnococcus provasolii]|mmetsp:Transcript_10750/g.24224  ORF Transcript_10750/g.24224 Transcript_10750/m.24224 type:complete len:161 (-) Transcript_10750:129-611(-)